jgi:ABC-type multidrug transport system permease subunit
MQYWKEKSVQLDNVITKQRLEIEKITIQSKLNFNKVAVIVVIIVIVIVVMIIIFITMIFIFIMSYLWSMILK